LGLLKRPQGKGLQRKHLCAPVSMGTHTSGSLRLSVSSTLKNVASRAVVERMGAKYERTATLFGSEAGILRHPPPE